MYNALKYTKKLEEVGFTRDQAEAQMEIVSEIVETSLATKQDIKDLSNDLRNEIQSLRVDLENKIAHVENKIIQSEYRMTIKLGTIVSVAIGVAVTLARMI